MYILIRMFHPIMRGGAFFGVDHRLAGFHNGRLKEVVDEDLLANQKVRSKYFSHLAAYDSSVIEPTLKLQNMVFQAGRSINAMVQSIDSVLQTVNAWLTPGQGQPSKINLAPLADSWNKLVVEINPYLSGNLQTVMSQADQNQLEEMVKTQIYQPLVNLRTQIYAVANGRDIPAEAQQYDQYGNPGEPPRPARRQTLTVPDVCLNSYLLFGKAANVNIITQIEQGEYQKVPFGEERSGLSIGTPSELRSNAMFPQPPYAPGFQGPDMPPGPPPPPPPPDIMNDFYDEFQEQQRQKQERDPFADLNPFGYDERQNQRAYEQEQQQESDQPEQFMAEDYAEYFDQNLYPSVDNRSEAIEKAVKLGERGVDLPLLVDFINGEVPVRDLVIVLQERETEFKANGINPEALVPERMRTSLSAAAAAMGAETDKLPRFQANINQMPVTDIEAFFKKIIDVRNQFFRELEQLFDFFDANRPKTQTQAGPAPGQAQSAPARPDIGPPKRINNQPGYKTQLKELTEQLRSAKTDQEKRSLETQIELLNSTNDQFRQKQSEKSQQSQQPQLDPIFSPPSQRSKPQEPPSTAEKNVQPFTPKTPVASSADPEDQTRTPEQFLEGRKRLAETQTPADISADITNLRKQRDAKGTPDKTRRTMDKVIEELQAIHDRKVQEIAAAKQRSKSPKPAQQQQRDRSKSREPGKKPGGNVRPGGNGRPKTDYTGPMDASWFKSSSKPKKMSGGLTLQQRRRKMPAESYQGFNDPENDPEVTAPSQQVTELMDTENRLMPALNGNKGMPKFFGMEGKLKAMGHFKPRF